MGSNRDNVGEVCQMYSVEDLGIGLRTGLGGIEGGMMICSYSISSPGRCGLYVPRELTVLY